MASILKVDDLRGNTSAGNITITSEGGAATQSLQQGLIKVWCNFDGSGTISTRDSLNQSSLTDSGTGLYKVNYTNDMNNTDYVANFSNTQHNSQINASSNFLASSVGLRTRNNSFTNVDSDRCLVSVKGDLA